MKRLAAGRAFADLVIAAFDAEDFAVDQTVGDLGARGLVELGRSGPGDRHVARALFVGHLLIVYVAHDFEFFYGEHDRVVLIGADGHKTRIFGFFADSSNLDRSCHGSYSLNGFPIYVDYNTGVKR